MTRADRAVGEADGFAAWPGSAPGRADLLRALAAGGPERLAATAELLDFEPRPRRRPAPTEVAVSPAAGPAPPVRQPTVDPQSRPAPAAFWQPVAREYLEELDVSAAADRSRDRAALKEEDLEDDPDTIPPEAAPIVAWPRLWRALEDRLKSPLPRREVDVDRLVRQWSRGRLIRRLPRRSGLAHARLAVILDRSERLKPFWADQLEVLRALARRLGRSSLRLLPPGAPALATDERLLILSDLGCYGSVETAKRWTRLGRELRRAGGPPPVALVPCPRRRWQSETRKVFEALDWEAPEATRPAHATDPNVREAVTEEVLRLAAVARRLERGLVRDLRRLVPGADLGTEADLWAHPAVRAAQAIGLVLDEDEARARRPAFAAEAEARQRRVVELLARWHRAHAPETWATEVADLLALGLDPGTLGEGSVERATQLIEGIAGLVEAGEGPLAPDAEAWLDRLGRWCSRGFWRRPEFRDALSRAVAALQQRRPDRPLPVGVTSEMVGGLEPRPRPPHRHVIRHQGSFLRAGRPGAEGKGSLIAGIEAREPRLFSDDGTTTPREIDLSAPDPGWPAPSRPGPLILVTDTEALEIESAPAPGWSRRTGRDRFGLWTEFEVGGVVQRLRWIPPGRFLMGSPPTEQGRWDDEGPQHEVRLSRGFWLADTPCTQALWVTVTGSNPSRFQSPERPVEQVSWDDCRDFCDHLAKKLPDVAIRLPTEAEWEYACRAGTETSTYAGEPEIEGERNAPLLDSIAWYGGNSGVDFELDNGFDTSTWTEMQFPADRSGTHPVAQKAPNPWGLYDTLGNAYEWCSDHWSDSYEGAETVDPVGPERGSGRVIRGGSWRSLAQHVRAAYRYWFEPGYRYDYLGFRLALGP